MRKGVLVLDTYVNPGLGGIDYDKKFSTDQEQKCYRHLEDQSLSEASLSHFPFVSVPSSPLSAMISNPIV
jgi:hypothetical protein